MTQLFIVIATILIVPVAAGAQSNYPNRPIKIVVPLPPGPFADALPRILAQKLSARWGQPIIIENRPGAASNLGAELVSKAEPNGYTLLATPQGPLVVSQYLYPKLGFDPGAFVPVTVIATLPNMLVVNSKVPASSLQELVALAKAHPDKFTYASAGIGSPPHLYGEMLKAAAGIRMVHVPYRGLGPAMTDLLAGQIDLMFDNVGNTLPQVSEGKLKILAVGAKTRIAELPDVPAVAETYSGFVSGGWYAMVAPPNTPPEIATKLSEAIAETLKLPDIAKRLRDFSAVPVGSSPAEMAAFLNVERERWRELIGALDINPE